MKFYALTTKGLELALDDELKKGGFQSVQKAVGGVWFESDWAGCYRANLTLRSTTRILWPLMTFEARTPEELYAEVQKHDFTQYIEPIDSLMVDAIVKDSEMTISAL